MPCQRPGARLIVSMRQSFRAGGKPPQSLHCERESQGQSVDEASKVVEKFSGSRPVSKFVNPTGFSMAMTKALLGPKIRRLRQERTLTQQQMAERLGISASYLNLIEHDERPVTVTLLLKLGQAFDVDLQELSDDAERRLAASLREVFADAGLGAAEVDAEEIRRLVANAPKAGRAIVDLYRAWRAAREDAQAMKLDLPGGRTRRIVLPTEEARDFFEAHANHF